MNAIRGFVVYLCGMLIMLTNVGINVHAEGTEAGISLHIGEPTVIAQGPVSDSASWGYFQYPKLYYSRDNTIICMVANKPDSITSYDGEYLYFVSHDKGVSWRPTVPEDCIYDYSLKMDNGRYFQGAVFQNAYYTDLVTSNEPLYMYQTENGESFLLYDAGDVSENSFQTMFPCSEFDPETNQELVFYSKLNWPHMPVRVRNGFVYPIGVCMYHFRMHNARMVLKEGNGNLLLAAYSEGFDNGTGVASTEKRYNIYLFRSSDNARTWDYVSQILATPDYCTDNSEGFTEPCLYSITENHYIILLRTGSGQPCYIAHSYDKGKSWEDFEVFSGFGVDPQLVPLIGDTLFVSYGRPGVLVKYSVDKECTKWSNAIRLDGRESLDLVEAFQSTCGYTSLLKIDEKTALLAYSDFKYPVPGDQSKTAKTILVRRIQLG